MGDPAELIARLLRANDRYDPLKEGDSGRAEYEAAYSALLAALTPPSPASIASAEAEKVLDALLVHCIVDPEYLTGPAKAARAAVLACMRAPQWQSIESAPKDGRPLLAFETIDYDGPKTLGNAAFREAVPGTLYVAHFAHGDWHVSYLGLDRRTTINPTHWTPLPAAPEPAR